MVMGRNGNGPKWSWAEMVMGRNDPESCALELSKQVGFLKKPRLGDPTLHKDGDKLVKSAFFL